MLEVEHWIIKNNPDFFIKEVAKLKQHEADLEQSMENLKQAELELLAILQSNQMPIEEKQRQQ